MYLDAEGKVQLGELKGASKVKATMRTDSADVSERWSIDADGHHVWTQNEELHIVEGDTIELPISLEGK